MTSKEALELISNKLMYERISDEEKQAMYKLKELVERDTPKKPIEIEKTFRGETSYFEECPSCNSQFSVHIFAVDQKFCQECGQRMDWS